MPTVFTRLLDFYILWEFCSNDITTMNRIITKINKLTLNSKFTMIRKMQIIQRFVKDIDTIKLMLKTWSKEKVVSEFRKEVLQQYRINMYKVVQNIISLRIYTYQCYFEKIPEKYFSKLNGDYQLFRKIKLEFYNLFNEESNLISLNDELYNQIKNGHDQYNLPGLEEDDDKKEEKKKEEDKKEDK